MKHNEQKLSEYIDRLNAEQKPLEDEYSTDSEELKELFQTVKKVRSLREPAMPDADFKKKLAHAIKKQADKPRAKQRKWAWISSIAALAAIFALIVNFLLPSGSSHLVLAMENAYQEVKAYHGMLEIVETNAAGKSVTQAKLEVWADKQGHYYVKNIAGPNQGMVTVNNGEKKWQIQHDQKQLQLFSAFPDAYRFVFELGNEIKEVKQAISTKVMGDSQIAGRAAVMIEVTPNGGSPYRIWVDKQTNLPLQKQTAMQNAIQYKVTYTQLDVSEGIPKQMLAYKVPEGYRVIDTNPEQFVNDLNEAAQAVGFYPKTAEKLPNGLVQDKLAIVPKQNLVKIYYQTQDPIKQLIVVQGKSTGEFTPVPTSILGKVGDRTAEIQSPIFEETGILSGGGLYAGMTPVSSIRWQQDGFEYAVAGSVSLEELVSFTKEFTGGSFELPAGDESTMEPQVKVQYDLAVEANDQKSVDAGNSPWKLDAVFTAQVFVSLQISPQGITGDYPISQKELKLVQNDGTSAIVEVNSNKTAIKQVYLKRIIRQDSTGIWTVVGYNLEK